MNIDLVTGALRIDSPAIIIHANTAPADLAEWCQKLTQNPPWDLRGFPNFTLAGERFAGLIAFENKRLKFLTLSSTRPEFGTSWADMSHEKESARQRFHNAWLEAQLIGTPSPTVESDPRMPRWEWTFRWGQIASTWDFKNGTSEIVIRYSATPSVL